MTSYEIEEYFFDHESVSVLPKKSKLTNWPVVYVISGSEGQEPGRGNVYLGETLNFSSRMRQHLATEEKLEKLRTVRVILDETFNKSVCLDLESYLIRLAAGDGTNAVLNRNIGIVNANYYNRGSYRETFNRIFEDLRQKGVFQRTIPQIVNSELFKLSPFKALTDDQSIAAVDIMEGLVEDLGDQSTLGNLVFVEGDPGTGKTVIAIYLMKLISDIGDARDVGEIDMDSIFSEFFLSDTRQLFQGLKIGLVVPQQSLRESIRNVFEKTPGLSGDMVLSPWDVPMHPRIFDILIVDEAHRLNQRSSQASGIQNAKFEKINEELFEGKRPLASQLDWLQAKARHLILMLDTKQTVRPQDLPTEEYEEFLTGGNGDRPRRYRLHTQMRSLGGNDYIKYVYDVLSHQPPVEQLDFGNYEVGLVDSPATLVKMIRDREETYSLSRLVAGYAWKWESRKNRQAIDLDLGEGVQLQWNKKLVDWVSSTSSIDEVGSIHTIQGYDLNFAGVIIGEDLKYDPLAGRLYIDRRNYHDTLGKQSNNMRNRPTTDDLLFTFITNIYAVLMTRGIRGTFIHVVNPELREYFRRYFPTIG